MIPKTMTGARAIVSVAGNIVGVYDSCTYSINIGAEPIHTLGRFSPNEIAVTSYEAVTVNCSGFRVVGNGAHVLPKFPKLNDLISLEGVQLIVTDRQGGATVLQVDNCIPVNYASGFNAKATSRIQITYLGSVASEENSSSNLDVEVESSGATNF